MLLHNNFSSKLILLLLVITPVLSTKTILVLGSHMEDILQDRMKAAINFANQESNDTEIIWYLSGGIKHQLDKVIAKESEANKMLNQLDTKKNWKFQLDNKAQNTAENFAYFRKWVDKQQASEIYITTSSFHFDRASLIAEGILNKSYYRWILGELDYPNCHHDEIIHSKNINNDINNALFKIYEM